MPESKLFIPLYTLIIGVLSPDPMKCFIFSLWPLLAASLVFAANNTPAAAAAPPILPKEFAGWQASAIQNSTDPAVADPANASLLKEYGFSDFASATYARDTGEKLTVRAARFQDASGAYGAFTFYKSPQMLNEKIGDQASSWNERVLFYRGNVLVDAVFQKLTAMSASELRELASSLPLPNGNAGNMPSLPPYLPRDLYEKNTAKYVLGPAGLEKIGAPLPAQLVGFETGAEVVMGKYNASGGEAALLLISYPTPQIAMDRFRQIDAAQASLGAKIMEKRTGPIIVVALGPFSSSEAKSLLDSVNYDANVTWNENTYFTKKDNVGNLVVNVIILCGIIGAFAIVTGVAFGGIRVMVKHFWPDKVFDRPEDVEFISLHLEESSSETPESPRVGS